MLSSLIGAFYKDMQRRKNEYNNKASHLSVQTWPKRLYSLDVSRCIASFSVVLWHWHHFAYVGESLPPDFDKKCLPLYSFLRLFYENGWAGVDYFFLLSGAALNLGTILA
jgi:peptidoglycan/LPS O-acetylase OafA/YrhL